MTREELEKRLESAEKQMLGLQDEIQNLKAKLAEGHYESEIPDFPVFNIDGESSWHVNGLLDVSSKDETYGKVHDYNFFHTVDYAQEFADKCKLIAMMLHCKWYLDRDYVPDWKSDTNSEKCYVIFDNCVNKFQVRTRYAVQGVEVYFRTEESAQKCAEWLNEHWRDSE